MGHTLNQYRFELLNIINQYSDDFDADYRFLDTLIINKRVKWFENTYNGFAKKIPSVYYQTLACVPVQLVDEAECCSTETGCYILRTVDKIPEILSLSDGELIQAIRPVGIKSKTYNIIPQHRVPYWGNSTYNKESIAAFLENDYIYLISKDPIYYPQLEKIDIRAVFRNPLEAGRFIGCDDQPCYSPESNFPLEERLWEYMKSDILANELKLKLTIPRDNIEDNQQNSTDLTKENAQKG